MLALVIDIVSPSHEVLVEIAECPQGMVFWVNRFGDLANLLGDLGIANKRMDKLGISRPKEPLTNGPISWFCPWPIEFGARVIGEQRFKVNAPEIGTSIDH